MISVHHLKKSFGETVAVNDLSFEIKQGEVVGFLGPNGAGKTTTMRLMAGFLSPDSGSIVLNGIPMTERTVEAQAHIGYMPENNPLYKDMLVAEILQLSAELKRIPKAKQKEAFDFAVSAVGIGDVFYRAIKELSKGYRQRVGLAVALLHRPKILILDEPTEGLDPNQRTEIRALVKTLAKDHTIVMSTHVMQEVTAVCSRILIIHQGKLVADGTELELSRKAKGEKALFLELEGDHIETTLQGLSDIEKLETTRIGPTKVMAKIITKEGKELRPEISRLAREHGWVLWKLAQEEHSLEDVFQALTQNQK